jgi:hypothetical protein
MAEDEPPIEITANAICCPVVCQFATFHGDDPELAAPVLERVGNQATIMEQPATTAQPPSNEIARASMFQAIADSLGPMMSAIAALDSMWVQA